MEEIPLYEEYRLIEKSESEINGAWRGAHLLLFFLAFVFGSFCTFCFHMLMYLFEEKCVLFPKLLSPPDARHNYIDYIPDKDPNQLPLDYVTTKWKDKTTCYLPTYVPLLSGVCGLVWTAMFLMCSSGHQTLTGLQRSWRILPPIFIFSLAMGGLCIYSSAVTQAGLLDLCSKLSEVTGGGTGCSFSVNVATLVYEKRIRGVYQAIRLTIISAWMHTTCWLMAAALAILRVLLVVDFSLVLIKADLRGNLEKMMELHETQVRTISPDAAMYHEDKLLETQFKSKLFPFSQSINTLGGTNDFYYISQLHPAESSVTLQTGKVVSPRTESQGNIPDSDEKVKDIDSLMTIALAEKFGGELTGTESMRELLSNTFLTREHAHTQQIDSSVKVAVKTHDDTKFDSVESAGGSPQASTSKKTFELIPWPDEDTKNNSSDSTSITLPTPTSTTPTLTTTGSFLNFPPPMRRYKSRKSNLKNTGVQTDPDKRYSLGKSQPKVQIVDSPVKIISETTSKETLVPIEKDRETHQAVQSDTPKDGTLTHDEIKEYETIEGETKPSDTKEQHEEKETEPPKTKEQPKPKEKQD